MIKIKIKSAGDTPEQVRARVGEVAQQRLLDTRMEDKLELAPRRPLPDNEYDVVRVHTARLKVPSVVLRMDGRYGVAYPSGFAARREPSASGWAHYPETFPSRLEAEQCAWKLARKFATTFDWR